jgi:hypothetical protein
MIYEVCHVVLFATDWCTRPDKWSRFSDQDIRREMQIWLEDCFHKIASKVSTGRYEFLEVFIEITLCLTIMASTEVTTAGQVLPQVGAIVYFFICTNF